MVITLIWLLTEGWFDLLLLIGGKDRELCLKSIPLEESPVSAIIFNFVEMETILFKQKM